MFHPPSPVGLRTRVRAFWRLGLRLTKRVPYLAAARLVASRAFSSVVKLRDLPVLRLFSVQPMSFSQSRERLVAPQNVVGLFKLFAITVFALPCGSLRGRRKVTLGFLSVVILEPGFLHSGVE
jgi:hypothetical protein